MVCRKSVQLSSAIGSRQSATCLSTCSRHQRNTRMPKRRIFLALLLLVSIDCLSTDLHKDAKLEIRLDQTLGSDISQAGQTFTATLNRSVSIGEKNVLQKGA